jgi:hypothetical protein
MFVMGWIAISGLLATLLSAPASADQGGVPMQPKVVQAAEGVFRCDSTPKLVAGPSLLHDSALSDAVERLGKRLHSADPPTAAGGPLPSAPFVLVGLVSDHPALKRLKAACKQDLPKEGLGEEGYLLDITPERILLAAERPAGVFYGIRRLLEQTEPNGPETGIPCGKIADWPEMRWRGMHLLVNSRASLPALEQLLTEILPRCRMNQLILEINYNYQYRSHPELASEGALTFSDCRHLHDLARRSFIRLIPMINCLGHQSWAKSTAALLTKHPEFDETPDLPPDNPGIYCRSWCPSNPEVYPFLFSLFDELIDAFQADAFHVGMDEVFILGRCPRCKGQDNATLFATAVNNLHRHLVGKRKVQMLMWGDRLLDNAVLKYGEWEASANGTAPALRKIPKDIVLCDWHYEVQDDFPSVKYLQEAGFHVWPSGWNRVENVQRFTACALKNQGPKMAGYLATTWTTADAIVGGYAAQRPPGTTGPDLAAAIRTGARIAWEGAPKPP